MADEPIITINDVRKAGHCSAGARRWCADHGFDFRAFLKDGLPESTVLGTGDALGLQVVQHKHERERG